jgi:hypothetical protein
MQVGWDTATMTTTDFPLTVPVNWTLLNYLVSPALQFS